MNKIGLFVDGGNGVPKIPKTLDRWEQVKTYKDFYLFIDMMFAEMQELPKIISINHDLTDEHVFLELRRPVHIPIAYEMYKDTGHGLNCCYFLTNFANEHNLYLNQVFVHGLNNQGCENMIKVIDSYYKTKADDKRCSKMNWTYE